jgi:hypothetical protein
LVPHSIVPKLVRCLEWVSNNELEIRDCAGLFVCVKDDSKEFLPLVNLKRFKQENLVVNILLAAGHRHAIPAYFGH